MSDAFAQSSTKINLSLLVLTYAYEDNIIFARALCPVSVFQLPRRATELAPQIFTQHLAKVEPHARHSGLWCIKKVTRTDKLGCSSIIKDKRWCIDRSPAKSSEVSSSTFSYFISSSKRSGRFIKPAAAEV